MKFKMVCRSCESVFEDKDGIYTCPACGGALTIRYVKNALANKERPAEKKTSGLWKYVDNLPLVSGSPVSLGEGGTPLIFLEDWGGLETKIFVKTETTNPTGSYKDRPATVSVSRAKELGARGVTVASDGNAAPAVAAFAARAGLPCVVFMPQETPKERYLQTAAYGALIILIDGDINDCLDRAEEAAENFNLHNCSTTQKVNPYQVEAEKTIAYEIVEQLGYCPDWISVPVGGGSLLTGIVRGMEELREAGKINALPKVIAVQAKACAPFVRAFEAGTEIEREKNPLPTVALTIAVPFPPDGVQAMEAMRLIGGTAVSVTEEELLHTVKMLAGKFGVLAEPSGAASLVGVGRLAEEKGFFSASDTVVSVITGTGLKSLDVFSFKSGDSSDAMVSLPNDAEAVSMFLKKRLNTFNENKLY